MIARGRWTSLCCALLIGWGLSGCSSPADPRPLEPTDSPTATASPTTAAPTLPPQARDDTPAGAAAFVHHYVDVFNHAARTGDVDDLERLSSPDCEGCDSYIDLFRGTYAAGGYFRGGDWKLGKLKVERSDQRMYVTVHVSSAPGTYTESRLDEPRPGNAEDSDLIFATQFTGGVWQVESLERKA